MRLWGDGETRERVADHAVLWLTIGVAAFSGWVFGFGAGLEHNASEAIAAYEVAERARDELKVATSRLGDIYAVSERAVVACLLRVDSIPERTYTVEATK